ncbi:hypothetical protein J8273_0714 [Carpediemonas membranifera]|uniref:Uncharacterized protein n=1 Tax=Carpediemonas membranifera TaxID=201153 RepID=A0A8J6E2F8_9EUKA|nr:hypothetical protein J8273_0714 [Carpediemonas membranifera]|eukprot:KAG9397584.1 hypothetical protein J8273_0714 [Carpediemonas membranifera]
MSLERLDALEAAIDALSAHMKEASAQTETCAFPPFDLAGIEIANAFSACSAFYSLMSLLGNPAELPEHDIMQAFTQCNTLFKELRTKRAEQAETVGASR